MNAPKTDLGTPKTGSLIERAAEAWGLDDFTRRPASPPFAAPEPPGAFAEPKIHATPLPPEAPEPAVEVAPEPRVEIAPEPAGADEDVLELVDPILAPSIPLASGEVEKSLVAARFSTSLETNGENGPAAVIDRAALAEAGMIVPGAAVSVLAEEFRLVKRQLLLTARGLTASPGANHLKARTILICSARPDEGKTFCAINLGISLAAERDTEVLLIDGDFAKRDLLPRMGLRNGPGFLDALADPVLDPERLVIRTDIPQLSLLGAGSRTNEDTELLASDRTRAVIARLLDADPKRIILFDSPPALAASPAGVFALHAGQVMMVVRADATTETDIREAVALLDGCDRIQLVLNQVRHQAGGYRFGDYYAPTEEEK